MRPTNSRKAAHTPFCPFCSHSIYSTIQFAISKEKKGGVWNDVRIIQELHNVQTKKKKKTYITAS